MNIRTPILLFLILVLPLALLAWLGQRSLMQDRIVAEHQAIELADSRLREAQTLVHGFINELEQSAVTALSFLQIEGRVSRDNINLIREVVESDPFLDQVFVLDQQRILLFPQDNAIHSNTERRFAESLTTVLSDPNTFRAKSQSESVSAISKSSGDDSSQEPLNSRDDISQRDGSFARISRTRKISEAVAQSLNYQPDAIGRTESGWTTWDTGTATDIYLWHRTSTNVLVGQKLSYAYWLSQMIARLPSGIDSGSLSEASIRLVDKRQRTIYQWGEYSLNDESLSSPSAGPLSKEWLTYPLDGWRLEYYAATKAVGDSKSLMFVISFLSLLALVGIGGRTIWKEYRREMRNAEQRVSFVNQVSHELKTPLTNICIYADMLEAEVTQGNIADAQRVKKFANVVTSESQRLGRLINNVLNFSRTQQQKISVHKSLVSVDDLIKLTLNNFTPAFASKGIEIETQLDTQTPVMLDSELLEQILNNLFSNVEKYAADGGLTRVVSKLDGTQTTILVCDAGQGIPVASREKIFEPFERGSDSLVEGVSGTGIGLSIARDLCRLHGGDLMLIDSDKGACFQVTLLTELGS
ncbi:MAG: signal transduction histidine kinase [Arenicella sp.]